MRKKTDTERLAKRYGKIVGKRHHVGEQEMDSPFNMTRKIRERITPDWQEKLDLITKGVGKKYLDYEYDRLNLVLDVQYPDNATAKQVVNYVNNRRDMLGVTAQLWMGRDSDIVTLKHLETVKREKQTISRKRRHRLREKRRGTIMVMGRDKYVAVNESDFNLKHKIAQDLADQVVAVDKTGRIHAAPDEDRMKKMYTGVKGQYRPYILVTCNTTVFYIRVVTKTKIVPEPEPHTFHVTDEDEELVANINGYKTKMVRPDPQREWERWDANERLDMIRFVVENSY